MFASINTYSLSSIYWRPLDFNIVGDKFSLKKESVYFDNGVIFNLFDALKDPKDSKFNRRTGLFLTNVYNNSGIFIDKDTPLITEPLTEIVSPIVNPYNSYVIKLSSSNGYSLLLESTDLNFDSTDSLKFTFLNDRQVTVQNSDEFYLTFESVSNYGLIFKPKITPLDFSQVFEYLLGENEITLFTDSEYTYVVAKYANNVFGVVSTPSTSLNSTLSSTTRLKLVSTNLIKFSKNSISNSFLAKYDINPIEQLKYLKITLFSV
jgi:hypothetical protein